jgi:hypothetical protein
MTAWNSWTFFKRKSSVIFFIAGFLAVAAYWLSVKPLGQGYAEDFCNHQMARQIMAENLREFGKPVFQSSKIMAPQGSSAPFFAGWNVERDWLGGYVFQWDRDFPFLWVYYGITLLICYLGSGWILARMGLPSQAAWLLSMTSVVFNFPRHFKLWHHSDNVMMHWIYLAFFLDAWIWQRFIRDRKWSVTLELWRGFLMLGVMNTMGYFWGPSLIEWLVVRLFMGQLALRRRQSGENTEVEFSGKSALIPVLLGLPLLAIDLQWFLELLAAAKKQGEIVQPAGWFANPALVLRPLWWDRVSEFFQWKTRLAPFYTPETVVTIGWLYLVPMSIGISQLRQKKGGPGTALIAPFLTVFIVGWLYLSGHKLIAQFVPLVQAVIPFMKFFRTASRYGLFLTPVATAMIALAWPQLSAFAKTLTGKKKYWLVAFAFTSCLEMTWISHPAYEFPKAPDHLLEIMNRIKEAPGDTVLSMPFCTAGANGICAAEQCTDWPNSTIGACLRIWHDKKVFGAYTSRFSQSDCAVYHQAPYYSWFSAWREDRCLTDVEWGEFCSFLKSNPQLSAVLVIPGVWKAAGTEACRQKFKTYLGDPIDSVEFTLHASRGESDTPTTQMHWYPPGCKF